MVIYFGADHRGFNFKAHLIDLVRSRGYEVADMGNTKLDEGDDYPDFARAVAEKVSLDPDRLRGVLICGSGAGMDIVANRFPGIRSVLAISADQVYAARHDDNVNVLTIAADYMTKDDAEKLFEVFFTTPFAGEEKYTRRLQKIADIEAKKPHS